MYGADDGPATSGQGLQQGDTLEAGRAVQPRGWLVEEHYRRVVHQL